MAHHLTETSVDRQADIAALASGCPSAQVAFQDRRIAATVLEEDDLLLLLQSLAYVGKQLRGEDAVHHLFALHLLCVDDLDVRQAETGIARLQRDESVLAGQRIVIGLQTWRCRPQQCLCSGLSRKDKSCIAGMIARCWLLLLEGRLVLLIDNDQAQTLEGEEYAAAHTNHDVVRCIGKHLLVEFNSIFVRIA